MSTNRCNNCNAKLYGEYCSDCGQQKKDLNISIFTLFKEILVNLFSLDSKIFNTLRLLLTKPGYLSSEYIRGKQKKYVLPGKMYLFLSVFSCLLGLLLGQFHQGQLLQLWCSCSRGYGFSLPFPGSI